MNRRDRRRRGARRKAQAQEKDSATSAQLESEYVPTATDAGKVAALRLVRELVIAKEGGPTAVIAPIRAMFALTSAGAPTMESAIYLANTLADGIARGYGPIALEEINRTLAVATLSADNQT